MSCNGCYGGCVEIIPDKCIKYTGVDITTLGISNGDNLLSVEQKIIQYLLDALNGSGIDITIDAGYLCSLVNGYLGSSTSLEDIIIAIIRSICNIDSRIGSIETDVATIEGTYTINCLSGVTSNSGTHAIVQAIITKLCTLSTTLSGLIDSLPATYVAISDLNGLIGAYLSSISAGSLIKDKMIPYVAYPYFQSGGSNFSVSGVGLGSWINVYLCNGLNGTPDLRGRVIVGTTTGMGGNAMNSNVDPNVAGNPSYSLNTIGGQNNITLSTNQIPSHSHATSISITDNGHHHTEFANETKRSEVDNSVNYNNYVAIRQSADLKGDYNLQGTTMVATIGKTSTATTGISATLNNPSVGSGESHSNIQPVIASNYIMFIP